MQLVSFVGIVSELGPVNLYGKDKNFPVQRVVVERTTGPWQVEFVGDEGVQLAEGLTEGCRVELDCNLSSKAWQKDKNSEKKYFLSLTVSGCKVVEQQKKAQFDGKVPVGDDITKMEDVPF